MIQLPQLAKVHGLVHGFSTVADGNMGFRSSRNQPEDGAPKGRVIKNRGQFARFISSSFHIGNGVAMSVLQPGYEERIEIVGQRRGGRGVMGRGGRGTAGC